MYYDGQFDDARMNVALAVTAATAGAVVANYTEAQRVIKVGGAGSFWPELLASHEAVGSAPLALYQGTPGRLWGLLPDRTWAEIVSGL